MPISFYISDLIQALVAMKVFHTSIFSLTFALLLAWAMYI
ncbi:MAG: hypothetical protein UU16_C0051G0008 [Candidatus Woesebacteria bacterium GW2011_GWA2_40_7]|uniref:Uncharacterized protein n=1 Tax=Candidatus Woesebacteria bacterium GW2011_GWA2_40_7 TaxID=1618562 RepID=A0A0G0VIR7_9BACT|nr:MAG: hypothetical protein UU16_C0051G0008 [Candidatus Woesebacteria bacterium GW2011_GWA2_40_7]